MRTSGLGGGSDELRRFRRLTAATVIATFLLIVIGGVVRVSESGLGCGPAGSGVEGWPLCTGKLIPSVAGSTLIEFTHRVVAGVVAAMIGLLAWLAWRGQALRRHPWLRRGSISAAALVLAQAALGGLTVEYNLHATLVAIHLGVAMLLLAILLGMYRAAKSTVKSGTGGFAVSAASESAATTTPAARPAVGPVTTGLKTVTAGAIVLTLATIMIGGYVAGTEGEGTVDKPVAGAHTACGTDFPSCGGELLPFGRDSLVDAQLTHRLLMFLATIAVVTMAGIAHIRGIRSRPAALAAVLVLLQVVLGALNVWLGKHAGLIVGHLTLATLLWGVVIWAALTFTEIPGHDEHTVRDSGAARAATAA